MIVLGSCKSRFANDSHPVYFDSIIEKFKTSSAASPEKSLAELDSAYDAFSKPGIVDKQKVMAAKLTFFYNITRDTVRTYLYIDSAIGLLKDSVYGSEQRALAYATILRCKAYCFQTVENYNDALTYYLMAEKEIAANVETTCFAQTNESDIADVLFAQGKFILAAKRYLTAYETASKCGEKSFVTFYTIERNLSNAGLCYLNAKMYDSAMIYFGAAERFITENLSYRVDKTNQYITTARAVVDGYVASVLSKQGDYIKADSLFSQSLKVVIKTDPTFTEMTLKNMAEIYIQTGDLNKAEKMLFLLDSMLAIHKKDAFVVQAYKLKAQLYLHKNNAEGFIAFADRYLKLKDSTAAAAKYFNSKNLETEFESNAQQGIMETLKKNRRLANLYLISVLLCALMIVFIGTIIWRNMKSTERNITNLKSINNTIRIKRFALQSAVTSVKENLKENNDILAMVVHDLRNPMVGINFISLFLLEESNDEEIKRAMDITQSESRYCLDIIRNLLETNQNIRFDAYDDVNEIEKL